MEPANPSAPEAAPAEPSAAPAAAPSVAAAAPAVAPAPVAAAPAAPAAANSPVMAIVDPDETARATKELRDIKAVVLDSAELATRSASLATTAGLDIKAATDKMLLVQAAHRKHNLIFLSASALIVTLAACVLFGTVVTQATRLTQIDAMLLAVGKRVTELDATMETVASVNEALNTMVKQQEENQALQGKLESRLDEVIKNTQSLPEVAAKQFEAKGQEMVKQVQSMDARLQTQANALRSVDQQLGKIQGQLNDSGQKLRQEVEALNRQQRERAQAEQNAARAAAAAAAAAAATTARQANPDRGVQYPRPVPSATPGQNPPAPATRP